MTEPWFARSILRSDADRSDTPLRTYFNTPFIGPMDFLGVFLKPTLLLLMIPRPTLPSIHLGTALLHSFSYARGT